jgi:MoaA/NifB/PqqE/SkfB family radical SAM enzyme
MENEKFKNLSELIGKHSQVKENEKSAKKKEEQFFLYFIENLCQIEAVNAVLDTVGVHVSKYDTPYIRSMRMIMERYYGELKTEIILWWVFESITPDGDIYPLLDEDGKKHLIKTPLQLFKFIKRYDGK